MGTLFKDFKIGGLRWLIIGLVFLATLINYIDRLTISVLAPLITKEAVSVMRGNSQR